MTEKDFYKKLGCIVKKRREKANLNPAQLAKKVGIPRSLLVSFEDDGKKISAFRLNQIFKELEIPTIEDTAQAKKKSLHLQYPGMRMRLTNS
jgi:ribosome-binding protein aMBF1 (putative translation factor)